MAHMAARLIHTGLRWTTALWRVVFEKRTNDVFLSWVHSLAQQRELDTKHHYVAVFTITQDPPEGVAFDGIRLVRRPSLDQVHTHTPATRASLGLDPWVDLGYLAIIGKQDAVTDHQVSLCHSGLKRFFREVDQEFRSNDDLFVSLTTLEQCDASNTA